METQVNHVDQLGSVAREMLQAFPSSRIFLLYGDMGAGKTTLIKALCEELGVKDSTSSPTFSIVNQYHSPHGSVYHFDFYRIKNEQEAFDMGYEEYFYSGDYCFVEWPQKIENLLPSDAKSISIDVIDEHTRKIEIK